VPRIHWVTLAQDEAAKLVVEMDIEDGREPNPLAVKIANATPEPQPRDADGNPIPYIDLPDD
jgi:hypothetical protein